MKLSFTKMHGLGNDFVVVDATEPATAAGADFDYRIYNSDGSESGQCLNGARCVARFIRERGLSKAERLRLRTRTTHIEAQLLADGRVRIDAGAPRLEPREVPFTAAARALKYSVTVKD